MVVVKSVQETGELFKVLLVLEGGWHLDDEWSKLLVECAHSFTEMIVVLRGIFKVEIMSNSFWEFGAEEEMIWSIGIPLIHHLRRWNTVERGIYFDRIKDPRIEFEIFIRPCVSWIERSNPINVGPPTASYSGAHLKMPNVDFVGFQLILIIFKRSKPSKRHSDQSGRHHRVDPLGINGLYSPRCAGAASDSIAGLGNAADFDR